MSWLQNSNLPLALTIGSEGFLRQGVQQHTPMVTVLQICLGLRNDVKADNVIMMCSSVKDTDHYVAETVLEKA